MNLELRQQFRIESARFLTGLAEGHPCSLMHGHSFSITLVIHGPVKQPEGWVQDYHEIDVIVKKTLSQLDHKVLNEVPGLSNPTSENLCVWLYEKISKDIAGLYQVIVSETPNTECRYPIRGQL